MGDVIQLTGHMRRRSRAELDPPTEARAPVPLFDRTTMLLIECAAALELAEAAVRKQNKQ